METGQKQGQGSQATQFQPGVSGNPNGRPKGKRNFSTVFAAAIDRYANEYLATLNTKRAKDKQKPLTMEEAQLDPEAEMVMAQIDKARKGDTRAFEALMKFQHPQKMQHSGDPENPIDVSVEPAKERAKRMLALYGFPTKGAPKPKSAPVAKVKADPAPEPTPEPKAPAQPKQAPKAKAVPPARTRPMAPGRKVSRKPLPNRYSKR